jgi:LPPG:FO 2-phospho-L-lactate transferase
MPPMIAVLCGGIGGSRFLRALTTRVEPSRVTAIVNTGDDDEFHGLYVSPDPDIITYTLAGVVDDERGWGLRGDTLRWLQSLRRFGRETWFNIGDRDLATHLHRTKLLREGRTLSAAIEEIARAFDVGLRLLPMSDDPVRTVLETDGGDLRFQEFLVKHHAEPRVRGVRFDGAERARPAPGVLDALAEADAIFIAPSNPVGSIAPILAVPGIRDAIAATHAPRIAVSPIIGGRSLQPPAAEMMAGVGLPVDVTGVARAYHGLIDGLVVDVADAAHESALRAAGLRVLVTPTIMHNADSSEALGRAVASFAGLEP